MLITTGSITTAARLAKAAEREMGGTARVVQTPRELNKGGCSYSVRIDNGFESDIRRIIKKYNINARKIYREGINGEKRVYRDIS